MRRERKPRDCALIVSSDSQWTPRAERALQSFGFAVAKLPDFHYADLVVAPGELRVLLVQGKMLRPAVAAHIVRLREHHAQFVVIVVGDCAREPEIKRALDGGGSIYLPHPFDDHQLLRVLTPLPAKSVGY